jgi:hypothetical protein
MEASQDGSLYVADPKRADVVPSLRAKSLLSVRLRPINDGETIIRAEEFKSSIGRVVPLLNEKGEWVVNGQVRIEHVWEEDGWIMVRMAVL